MSVWCNPTQAKERRARTLLTLQSWCIQTYRAASYLLLRWELGRQLMSLVIHMFMLVHDCSSSCWPLSTQSLNKNAFRSSSLCTLPTLPDVAYSHNPVLRLQICFSFMLNKSNLHWACSLKNHVVQHWSLGLRLELHNITCKRQVGFSG